MEEVGGLWCEIPGLVDPSREDVESGPDFLRPRWKCVCRGQKCPGSESRERRVENVDHVAKSLADMVSLVTILVGRPTTLATSARMETPMGGTQGGSLGMGRLESTGCSYGSCEPRALTNIDRIMGGTFSSDDTETAARRAVQGELQVERRGVPGALLGPLVEPCGR